MKLQRRLSLAIPVLLALGAAGMVYAQLEGSERGIPPVDSASSFEVTGIEVDVVAENANAARLEGWRRAQSEGWKLLWARTNNRPVSEAPTQPESVLSSIVSGVIIEQEQIGPRRYIARLGILFDRSRTGQMLGVRGLVRRSAAMLVIPVMVTAGTGYSMEFRNEWQHAWARFRTANSPIDYVRTSGSGADPLLLNAMQTGRRSRGWWRVLLDQYGAADILVPEVRLRRLYPGGPALATFTARRGPDNVVLARFELRAPDSASIPRMLDEGVRRLDAIYVRALEEGLLRPDPTLRIPQSELEPPLEEEEEEEPSERESSAADGPDLPQAPGSASAFRVQVDTPDSAAVQRAEIAVSRVSGVTSALTTSLALGGTSTMRVTYVGEAAGLAAALQAQGWSVEVTGGNSLRISR
ncbi:heavy-metal-associated domain-containing protein [Allosphingosinicella sp.]|uniref:heavy-metal-associated domain-containing protein n=1 Tax=Allosphingosinicella sp. TaxID=2823234 RepID=UPI002EF94E4D